tara:strand:+ start:232 stop:528 length:297 start_codon:yes stop_codon:yes gene_type:complete
MITFNSFLNEGKLSWGGMQFTVSSFVDRDGMYISFIPNSKTLDLTSTESLAERVKDKLDTKMPLLASTLEYKSDHHAAGLTFKLNQYDLADAVIKGLK